ncbi:MAG TPA: EF-hand domain-containing protein [Povalibacter sp.]|jgi:Ca2+-binding EF-hand superfamily protein|nr:EF-hand domain-containing protein [Povalibacter sp.]
MTSDDNRHAPSRHELHHEFAMADKDHDGRITFDEFVELLEGLDAGMSAAEMRIGFAEIDTDRDGAIDRREFAEWWSGD